MVVEPDVAGQRGLQVLSAVRDPSGRHRDRLTGYATASQQAVQRKARHAFHAFVDELATTTGKSSRGSRRIFLGTATTASSASATMVCRPRGIGSPSSMPSVLPAQNGVLHDNIRPPASTDNRDSLIHSDNNGLHEHNHLGRQKTERSLRECVIVWFRY